jgi:PAS domain S-box-containing protein
MKDLNKAKDQRIAELQRAEAQRKWGELKTHEALRYAESIIETVREPLVVLDARRKVLSANRSFYTTFKVTPADTLRHTIYELGNGQWDIPQLRTLLEGILSEKESFEGFEVVHNFKDIGRKVMLLNARRIYRKTMGTQTILLAIEDITERRGLESTLKESEELYRRIYETASDGILLLEKSEGKITHVNPAFGELLGYSTEETIGRKLQDVGMLPDLGDFQRMLQVLEESGIIHYRAVPVRTRTGQDIDTDIYLVDKTRLVQCNVCDITDRKLGEESLLRALAKLRKSLGGTIQAMSLTVESRDPYTAGHQRRVSSLGRAIAQEMALPNDTVDAIRMAGAIHDIGKVSIPAEILSRPGRLSDIEMSLVKTHSQTGYDILKDVELPYPVARMVLEHHERMDGSGYPRGLKGEEIIAEARILAVADVVEAMASNRPYRGAFPVDAALEEIERNAGELYDKEAVVACLELFRNKGFRLE